MKTNVPPWAHRLIDTYFDNWPCEETQEAYKAAGMRAYQYWLGELRRIFGSTLEVTPEFRAIPLFKYYIDKYAGDAIVIKNMDRQDKTDIFRAFTTQLGMHWATFPLSLDDCISEKSP